MQSAIARAPWPNITKNFKMIAAEHEPKCRSLPRVEPVWSQSHGTHAHEASAGCRESEL